jgi:hypothetical protein
MAKVILQPIGRSRDTAIDAATYERQQAEMRAREARILAGRDTVEDGWGDDGRKRVHKKGKLTTWERLASAQGRWRAAAPRRHPRQLRPRDLRRAQAQTSPGRRRRHGLHAR